MSKILVTDYISGLVQLVNSDELERIVAVPGGSELYFKTPYRGRMKVTETLAVLFAQQNTTLFDLGMILVTDSTKNLPMILFVHNFDNVGVVQEKNQAATVIGSRIVQKGGMNNYVVSELIAAIYAQQKAGVNLGMNLLTRSSDGAPIVVMDQHINYIIDEVVSAVTTTYVVFKDTQGKIAVDEACAAIYGAQSA